MVILIFVSLLCHHLPLDYPEVLEHLPWTSVTISQHQRILINMLGGLTSKHVEGDGTVPVVHAGEVYTDDMLRKAGAEIKEENVVNVQLVLYFHSPQPNTFD